MNLERALTYLTHHSESIIQWVFLAILLLAGFLIARVLMGSPEAAGGGASGVASGELDTVVEKIMMQMTKLEGVSLKDAGPAGVADVQAQVEVLKKELAAREAEINTLKATGGAAATEAADVSGLNTRIKELESKLAEYEILGDDIADLSLYKEENTRLRAELEKTKGGAVIPAAAVPTPEPQSGEAIVAEFAQAVGQEPEGVASAPAPAPAPASVTIPDTGNPMADFESTVKLERELSGGEPTTVTTPAPPPPAAPAAKAGPVAQAAPAPASTAQAEADDLFAEFANAPAEATDSGPLDTDKMMAEMAALVSIEPASGNALEESIDMEKMSMEASAKKS